MSEDLKRRVKEALERTDIMALSTIGTDGPWTAPVQYRYNEKLDLFFLSMPGTKHVRHISSDPRVSAAIYSHPGPPGGNLGLQISGTAEHLTGESSASGWQSFKIKQREIWCFDSRVFGRERRQVDISDLRLLLPTAWGRLKRACRECR
jgi:uncharacterized protein YhbP (UPF0306 family)